MDVTDDFEESFPGSKQIMIGFSILYIILIFIVIGHIIYARMSSTRTFKSDE